MSKVGYDFVARPCLRNYEWEKDEIPELTFNVPMATKVICFSRLLRVPTSSGNHGKPGKSHKKAPCMEKSWNLKKKLNNLGKIMEFCEIDKTTNSQKTSCPAVGCVSDS